MQQQRTLLYALVNVGFVLFVAAAAAFSSADNIRTFYLFSLFALCSLPLLFEKRFNGPYALLTFFLAVYFVYFGINDVPMPWSDRAVLRKGSEGMLSESELVILVGAALSILAYQTVAMFSGRPSSTASTPKDWSPRIVVLAGLALWAIGTYASWVWNVDLLKDTSSATARRALTGMGSIATLMVLVAQLAKPLGIVVIAYAQTMYRRPYLLPLLLGVVFLQIVFGFIVDIKGEAMLGGLLVIVTKTLVEGKLPKAWLAGAALFVVFAFPVFQAHRTVAGSRGTDHTKTAQNFGKMLDLALAAKDKVNTGRNRAQSFFERASLKPSVEMIVRGTGTEAPYQDGATLAPVLTAFVPKIFWAEKPSVPTGRILNRAFHVSPNPDTYISPSHIGELYWNFGWAGVIVGMSAIGVLLGLVGTRCDLSETPTLTRLLLMVLTIRQCIQGFEGVIAVSYVVWLRSVLAVLLLHWVLARVPAMRRFQRSPQPQEDFAPSGQTSTVPSP